MLLKSFRYLTLPLSFVYGIIIKLRNLLYDKNILKSASFNFPIICVGNLAVGGTGKTPMTEYIIQLLGNRYQIATLSRGYKRKTTGFAIANETTTAIEIGDEPMQFHQKFPHITVAVGEERLVAIPQLLHQRPQTQCIILDDAFQHRQVKAGLNILLTDFKNLYTRDFMLPAGDLRDVRSSSKRAQCIVVTKCKSSLSIEESRAIIKELNPHEQQQVFFSEIQYGMPYHLFSRQTINMDTNTQVLLITGIANPRPIQEFLNKHVHSYDMLRYADHHIFDSDDLKDIQNQYSKMNATEAIILTTEKDAVRLQKFEPQLKDYPIYAIPIQHHLLFDGGKAFEEMLCTFIQSYTSK